MTGEKGAGEGSPPGADAARAVEHARALAQDAADRFADRIVKVVRQPLKISDDASWRLQLGAHLRRHAAALRIEDHKWTMKKERLLASAGALVRQLDDLKSTKHFRYESATGSHSDDKLIHQLLFLIHYLDRDPRTNRGPKSRWVMDDFVSDCLELYGKGFGRKPAIGTKAGPTTRFIFACYTAMAEIARLPKQPTPSGLAMRTLRLGAKGDKGGIVGKNRWLADSLKLPRKRTQL